MPTCNICGGEEFMPGPNGRLSESGEAPRCVGCNSLERQRSLRACLLQVPSEMLAWRRALQFAPDASLDPAWFRSFETSTYGGENSIDLQEIGRPDGSYDFISLSMVMEFVPDDRKAFGELARIGSGGCIVHNSSGSMLNAATSTHHDEPHGSFGRHHYYGSDLEERLEVRRHGFSAVRVQAVDPVTGTPDAVHFFCRQNRDAEVLGDSFTAGVPAFEVSVETATPSSPAN
jgi:hypothetical protein